MPHLYLFLLSLVNTPSANEKTWTISSRQKRNGSDVCAGTSGPRVDFSSRDRKSWSWPRVSVHKDWRRAKDPWYQGGIGEATRPVQTIHITGLNGPDCQGTKHPTGRGRKQETERRACARVCPEDGCRWWGRWVWGGGGVTSTREPWTSLSLSLSLSCLLYTSDAADER